MENFMQLTDRRGNSMALSLQACSKNYKSINGKILSNLKVRTTWVKCESAQAHIEKNSRIYITHDSDGKISRVKFKKFGFWNKDYIFTAAKPPNSDTIKGDDLTGLTPLNSDEHEFKDLSIVKFEGIQDTDNASHNNDGHHEISAYLVKIGNKYVAIDFNYWDFEKDTLIPVKCEETKPKSHGRGGGGGWN